MKKAIPYIVIVILLIIAGVGYVAVKNNNKPKNTTSSNSSSMQNMNSNSSSNSSSTNTTPVATDAVKIQNFAFSPSAITVKKGTTVTWTNFDVIDHTVTENDGKTGPSSGDLAKGQTYTFTYNDTGTYTYHCSIHTYMTGKVVVTD